MFEYMSETNEKRRPVKYYADTRAKYEQYMASGLIKEGDECWIEETREIVVFGNSFGGDYTKKQDTLVDGENIKTINGESLLGSGNIEIKSGSDIDPEALEGFIPLSRDFSDDFNNDFSR